MSQKLMTTQDLFNPKLCQAYLEYDGRRVELYDLVNLKVKSEVEHLDIPILGAMVNLNAPKGFKYSGSFSVYTGRGDFSAIFSNMKSKGKGYFNILIENKDVVGNGNSRVTILKNCSISSEDATLVDVEGEVMKDEYEFVCEDKIEVKDFEKRD